MWGGVNKCVPSLWHYTRVALQSRLDAAVADDAARNAQHEQQVAACSPIDLQ